MNIRFAVTLLAGLTGCMMTPMKTDGGQEGGTVPRDGAVADLRMCAPEQPIATVATEGQAVANIMFQWFPRGVLSQGQAACSSIDQLLSQPHNGKKYLFLFAGDPSCCNCKIQAGNIQKMLTQYSDRDFVTNVDVVFIGVAATQRTVTDLLNKDNDLNIPNCDASAAHANYGTAWDPEEGSPQRLDQYFKIDLVSHPPPVNLFVDYTSRNIALITRPSTGTPVYDAIQFCEDYHNPKLNNGTAANCPK